MDRIPKLKNYRAFLFDWDGTLFPTTELWDRVLRQYITENGKSPRADFAELVDHLQAKHRKADNYYVTMFGELCDIYGIAGGGERLCKRSDEIAHGYLRDMNYIDGADDLLLRLVRARQSRGIVSSAPRRNIDTVMNENENVRKSADLRAVFGDKILTANDVPERKPNATPYLMGLKMVGANIENEKLLIFEDSLNGVTAGINAKNVHPNIDVCIISDAHSAHDHEQMREMTPLFINSYPELLQNQ